VRPRYQPAAFTDVAITDAFWAPRIATNHARSIPSVYQKLKETGRVDAFRLDWKPGMEPVPHIFWDSDVAKWVEGASYDLALHPDPERAALLEEVTDRIASAQQPDGYLNVHFTVVEPEKRWANLRHNHELYCAGHLLEAALAYQQATGRTAFLDAMCRYVDYIATVFGREPGKRRGYCGHEEIELALVKLYRETREARYLELSRYFVEERGQRPNYFEAEGSRSEPFDASYLQAHVPLREQTDAVGHSVRAMYLYCAAADLAAETRDAELRAVCDRLWESATERRMYLTGGLGSERRWEGFTADYDLPNDAYAETCASIGLVYFAHRMLQFECDRRYSDVMERALYNGVISGVSLSGTHFFYENPLASRGAHHRQDWFDCACCPTNVVRLLPTLGSYVYSTRETELAVHLYAAGSADLTLGEVPVTLRQETRYPWEGKVWLTVEPATPLGFSLRLRLPGWCRGPALVLNGNAIEPPVERGYAVLARTWQPGDVVELDLPMPVEKVEAHPAVTHCAGRLALQRGPIVYCLEDVDHAVSVHDLALSPDAEFTPRFDPDLLGGVVVLEGDGLAPDAARWEGALYLRQEKGTARAVAVRAVPYCVWDNRAAGGMAVWIPRVSGRFPDPAE